MTEMFFWYFGIAVILFGLALISVIRRTEVRLVLATLLFMGSLVYGYFGLFALTGTPRPVSLMLVKPHVKEAVVLGGHVEEDVGIFVLLQAQEIGPVPVYVWFPYSKKAAENFQKAQRKGRERGQKGGDERFVMVLPFEESLENREDDIFREIPQPKLPDKPDQAPPERLSVPQKQEPPTRQF